MLDRAFLCQAKQGFINNSAIAKVGVLALLATSLLCCTLLLAASEALDHVMHLLQVIHKVNIIDFRLRGLYGNDGVLDQADGLHQDHIALSRIPGIEVMMYLQISLSSCKLVEESCMTSV